MQHKKIDSHYMVLLAMLCAIMLIMAFTPLGYLNIGALAITLNMIPVAVGAVALGPTAGAFLGAMFGITSCLQCVGIGGSSPMGVILYGISPFLAIVQRFVPRLLAGWLSGLIFSGLRKKAGIVVGSFVTGFCAAILNTVLFMLALVLLFGNTEYLRGLIGGRNILLFAVTFVGVNALVEILVTTLVVGSICTALKKARLIGGK